MIKVEVGKSSKSNELCDDMARVEEAGERDNPLRSGSRAKGGVAPWGDWIVVRQSSTSPVARELTIADDSNGSNARDLFNLPEDFET
jgi:hypothetical protein